MHLPRALSIVLSVAVAACGSDEGSLATSVEARDSAGIRIVESRVPGGVAPVYAELGEPDLQIGVVDGDPTYAFTRIVAVRALANGAILVAEGGSQELRVFDGVGTHVRTFGGAGRGPGELTNIMNVAGISGDTIRVWDARARRVTSFLADGTFLGDLSLSFDRFAAPRWTYSLDDGSLLVDALDMPAGGLPDGPYQAPYFLRRMDGAGLVDTVATLPGEHMSPGEAMMTLPDGRRQTVDVILGALIDNEAHAVASGEHFYVGYNDHYLIQRRTFSGDVDMVISVPDLERPMEAAALDSVVQYRLDDCSGRGPDCERMVRMTMEAFDPPEMRPAYSALLVDAGDRLWVADWVHRGAQPTVWHVFSPDGELLGRVAIPDGLRVTDVQEYFVLGVIRNELDVPFVRRYPLTRLPGA